MKLNGNFDEITAKIEEGIGVGKSYDANVRLINIFDKKIKFYYMTGLVDNLQVIAVIMSILRIPRTHEYSFELILNNISHQQIEIIDEHELVLVNILNGLLAIVIEDYSKAIIIDTRSYPTRGIAEPDTEKVIRGAHDGFTENFAINTALIRRRIKDGSLRNEVIYVGDKSPAYVCLTYLEGICDEALLNNVRERIKKIKVDQLIMSDKALEELIVNQRFNPYPLVRYTERADTVAVHLYQGMFAILVDTSPSVILGPATFFDHLQHTEEYRQTPLSGTYLRMIRFLGVFISIFLTPIWLLLLKNDTLAGIFAIMVPSDEVKMNIFIQVIIAEVGVEFLRMASIHTPSALSIALGLIAGVLLGDIAVAVGLFSIQTVLLVALSAIGNYVTPSYELSLANKISKLLFIVLILAFNYIGFIVGVLVWLIMLSRLKSFNKPYLYPLIPLNLRRLLKVLIRYPYKNK